MPGPHSRDAPLWHPKATGVTLGLSELIILVRIFLAFLLYASLAAAQLRIDSGPNMPGATQYENYIAQLSASGGTPPYRWSVVSATSISLPEGMRLDSATGTVSSPKVFGQGGYSVTVQVTDSGFPNPGIATKSLNFGVHSDSGNGGCEMFPPDSLFRQRTDQLPLDVDPAHQIPTAYLSSPIHPDFGGGFYPSPAGIPFMRVPANQPLTKVNIMYEGQVDPAGIYTWPLPPWPDAVIETTSYGLYGDDHHILVLQSSVNDIDGPQTGPCTLYETYHSIAVKDMFDAATGTWLQSGGVHYVLNSNQLAASPDTLDNGANDSAGIPILPLLLRYSEVPLGARHPLRISFPSPTNWFVWPGTGCCLGVGPPQGLLYRLKAGLMWQATCPVETHPQAATVLQALQQYGAYMSDHGGVGFVGGVPDDRWEDTDLACIKRFSVSDLEVVDNSPLEVSAISGQTRPYVVPAALPNGNVGAGYSAAFSAVGGNPGSRRWSISAGSLPPGVLLDAVAGTVSGDISSAGGPFNFSLTATDAASGYASLPQPFVIYLGASGPTVQLSMSKTHTGVFKQGLSGALYTVTVSNPGPAATIGTVTVAERVPDQVTLVSMAGLGWSCPGGAKACTRNDSLSSGSSYPAITVTVNFSRTVSTQIINEVTLAGGGSPGASAQDVTSLFSLWPQSITFGVLPDRLLGSAPFALRATATSGLPVVFESTTPAVCTSSGTNVTLITVGTCTIQATQDGDKDFVAATPVHQSLQVTSGVATYCDIDQDGATTVVDMQRILNEAFGVAAASHDLNGDGIVNIADIQIVVSAALGSGCTVR
jgi:hypothetical protein